MRGGAAPIFTPNTMLSRSWYILPGCERSHVRVFELFIFAARTVRGFVFCAASIKLAKASD